MQPYLEVDVIITILQLKKQWELAQSPTVSKGSTESDTWPYFTLKPMQFSLGYWDFRDFLAPSTTILNSSPGEMDGWQRLYVFGWCQQLSLQRKCRKGLRLCG